MEIFSDSLYSGIHPMNYFYAAYLPPANEVWGKVMFSKVFVCLQGSAWGEVSLGVCIGRSA